LAADAGVSCHDDVVTCDVPFGGFILFNNVTVHRRFLISSSLTYYTVAYLQRAFLPVSRCVTVTKIHQDFPVLLSQMYWQVFFVNDSVYALAQKSTS